MKVAYWPGCVSRGFTPELHGSMARVAPLLVIRSTGWKSFINERLNISRPGPRTMPTPELP